MAEGVTVATLVAQLKLDLGNFQQGVQNLDRDLNKARRGLEGTGKQTDAFSATVTKAEARLGAMGIQSAGLSRALALLSSPLTIVGVALGAMAFGAHQATEALIENAREVRGLMAVSGLGAEAADNLGDTFTVLGFNAGTVAKAMFSMSNEIESGAAGLGRLGISTRDAAGNLKAEGEIFLEVRDRISQLGSAGERSAALLQIFTRSGRELAPVFALSREEFQKWMQTASALSPWSQQTQADTEALIRSQNALGIAWKGMWEELGKGLAGPAAAFNDWLRDIITGTSEAISGARQFLSGTGAFALSETGGAGVEPGGATGPGAAAGTGITRRTQAEFGQEAALLRLSLQQRMAHFDQVAALRAEAVAREQIDQRTLLQGALADFAAREQATRQYFAAQRAIIVEQMGSTEAAAKTKLAELDAQQISAISQIGTARITARGQLAALELAQTKQLQAQEIAGWVAVAEEKFALTEQRLQNEVKFRDELKPLWEQVKQDGIAAWVAIAEEQLAATEQMEQSLAGARDQLRAFFQEGRDLQEFGLAGIAGRGQALRGAGVAFDTSGAQQSAVESRVGALTQQLAQWQSAIANVEQGTERFDELQGSINAATGELTQLTTALGGLQQLNSLKGLFADVFGSLNRAVSTSITGIIQGTLTAQQAWRNLGQSIVLSIAEVIIQRGFKAMATAFDSMLDEMDARAITSAAIKLITGLVGAFAGGSPAVSSEPTAMAAGGIVEKPTVILAGEQGSEAIIPLSELGRYAGMAGGGDRSGPLVEVTIINQSNSEIEHKESSGSDGMRKMEIVIRDAVKKQFGSGEYDKLMGQIFGISRQGTSR